MNTNKNLISENSQSLNSLRTGFLCYETFRALLEYAVIPTVDFILTRPDASYMLITRVGSLWPGAKWMFGGRQLRGETLDEALSRLAKREAGIQTDDILNVYFSHHHDLYNPPSQNLQGQDLPATHTLMHVYVLEVSQEFVPRLDETSKNPEWYAACSFPNDLPDVMKYNLARAGFI